MSSPDAGLLVALVGNPNTGKSTLFNALTGLRQRVGNYPGVTVSRKSGTCDLGDGQKVELVDLPGLYSLAAASPDEQVVIDALSGNIAGDRRPDAVVMVVDATNLLRNLFLASQVAELGLPLVLVLNQADVAKEQGLRIDTELLSRRLGGVPVILTSAWKGEGIPEVRRGLAEALARRTPMKRVVWPADIAGALADVAQAASGDTGKAISAADAQRLLFDTNASTAERLGWTLERREKPLRGARERVRNSGYNPMAAEPLVHYAQLRVALDGVVAEGLGKAGRTAAVDRLLLHRVLGPVQGPDEAQHVGALKARHGIAAAQNVHSKRVIRVEQGVEFVKQRFRRIVLVAVHFVENHFALFGNLALRDRGMLDDVKKKVHGAAVVLDHEAGVEQRVFFARIGV